MNVLMLSPGYPPEMPRFALGLRAVGARVIGMGDQPASAAWTIFQSSAPGAGLYGGATLPQFRGRGHYTRLLAVRAQEALTRGVTMLSVDASPMSRPILEKHGFQYLATTTPCKWKFKPAA